MQCRLICSVHINGQLSCIVSATWVITFDDHNPKDIKFIDLPIAKNGKFGLVNAQPPYKLVDLWGTPYYVLLDTNGDKQVMNPDLKNSDPTIAQNPTSPPPQQLPAEIAVYSYGKDRVAQTKDDVVSWRSK